MTEEVAATEAPGAAVVIVDGDGVLFAEGFGVAAKGGEPLTPDTPFHIASLSKAITGLAVMQMVEAGRFNLNTTLGGSGLGLDWSNLPGSEVTVGNLLSHTSGWSEYDGLVNRLEPEPGPGALEANAQRIAGTPLRHPVGEFEYSNANYDLLGYLVERASGIRFADYLRSKVFAPLGMTNSFATESEALAAGVAEGLPVLRGDSQAPVDLYPEQRALFVRRSERLGPGQFPPRVSQRGTLRRECDHFTVRDGHRATSHLLSQRGLGRLCNGLVGLSVVERRST